MTACEEELEPGLAGCYLKFLQTDPGDLYLEVGRRCSQLSSVTLVRGE